ncbi:MAG TPA: metallophosphoesterase [Desulfobulbus sp.]|nr:metallophosphoesterase [Desulfobulbus sp.]
MRLAVFADIHANLAALQAVVADMAERNVHRHCCLGDIVGYGPQPNECIDLVRSLPRLICIRGNHDAAATWHYSPYSMQKQATAAILWTMDQLRPENAAFLEGLPLLRSMGNMLFAHANPYNPGAFRYVLEGKYARRSFGATRQPLIFVGHTHIPMIITRPNIFRITFLQPRGPVVHRLDLKKRHIINCGSVGQPRDRDPRACYCIWDTREQALEYRRLEYDTAATAAGIRAIDALSDSMIRRLRRGL